ncbi:MAG TPA: glycoside hydrolase family 30 beta sandwich domain-containing protein [Agriterribacter sp.]|nr:glycoside hydrolase family 30 beta sandwich domain-containing protein [Agriterribacter sp.]
MRKFILYFSIIGFTAVAAQCDKESNGVSGDDQNKIAMDAWVTRGDQSVLLDHRQLQSPNAFNNTYPAVTVNEAVTFQTVDGFGYTLTGGSAMLINQLSTDKKKSLLQELFGLTAADMAISYLRLSMGASDLDEEVFSYNDLPPGETDIDQQHFSIARDKINLIPVLKQILGINPSIKIIATPWSPPVWMKDNSSSIGGSLKPEYYQSYATYFVKYIEAMKAEGITITAITPQNEPLHPGNNPSMYMSAEQQRDFIKKALGPAFATAGLNTKIVIYDHNLDRPDYPLTVLSDGTARQYIDGSAFHLYAGNVNRMSEVHEAYPDKNIYFTEQWTGANGSFDGDLLWHTKNVIIGTMRNWSKVALEWNLANDPQYKPHTDGGCTECKGALTIRENEYSRNVSYYIIGHASKFVPPGSKRIESNPTGPIQNVCFLTPDGKRVMITANEESTPYTFNLKDNDKWAQITIEGKTVMTLVW